MAVRQNILKNRLEEAIERNGYDRRLAKPFMNTYCGRRIAKRALKNHDLNSEYGSLSKYIPK